MEWWVGLMLFLSFILVVSLIKYKMDNDAAVAAITAIAGASTV